jgi:hypothetical protein
MVDGGGGRGIVAAESAGVASAAGNGGASPLPEQDSMVQNVTKVIMDKIIVYFITPPFLITGRVA